MSTVQALPTDQTLAKIRTIMAMDGVTGQAGEVAITLANQPGATTTAFHSANVTLEGIYSVSVSTEEAVFLSLRPDGSLVVHVGPNTGTLARFHINRTDGFEFGLSAKETRYVFHEKHAAGETRLTVNIRW